MFCQSIISTFLDLYHLKRIHYSLNFIQNIFMLAARPLQNLENYEHWNLRTVPFEAPEDLRDGLRFMCVCHHHHLLRHPHYMNYATEWDFTVWKWLSYQDGFRNYWTNWFLERKLRGVSGTKLCSKMWACSQLKPEFSPTTVTKGRA